MKNMHAILLSIVLCLQGHCLQVEVADTPQERAQGLSDKESMPEDMGMLICYDEPTIPSFTMRRMHFNLDFIWLREGEVVDLTENVSKDFKGSLQPRVPVDQVLEVNAGWIKRHNIKI